MASDLIQDAFIRNLQTMAESATRVSTEMLLEPAGSSSAEASGNKDGNIGLQ
jgi:hypothetical protein